MLQGPWQGVGCWEFACPPPLYPLNIPVGVAPPITNPAPILGYPEPPKSTRLSPGGGSPGAGSAALTPSPSWKAASGLSVRFLRFKPDFPDGWRAMRRSSDMPQGHTGPGRRRISSSEGWLGAPFPARWGLRTPSLGTRGVLWDYHPPPQAGRQLPWHPKGNAGMGCCPTAAPQWVLAPWNGTGGNVPGWAAAQ